ncbi:MAG: hypothetical protein PHO34_04245 [Candidatus Omnitrophica bacterium]|nr:hypothetical protein [Candidatus Omnitrophota bacterium]MDD5500775.1 hypothetical protein [Candidatus Omnitrophota bacterium]
MRRAGLTIIAVLWLSAWSFAEESITITTYYPSPYGSYNELGTNKLAVGDTDGSGSIDAGDQPNFDGNLRLKPKSGNPSAWSAGKAGEFSYSSSQDSLYHYNGSTWVASGGGGTCVVTYNSPVGSCSCPSGWTLKLNLGTWGWCMTSCGDGGYFLRPPGATCGYDHCGNPLANGNQGQGCLCCK